MSRSRFLRALAPTALALSLCAMGASASAASLSEGSEVVVPAGWTTQDKSSTIGIDTLTITAVPEPATDLMMALGVGGLLLRRRGSRA